MSVVLTYWRILVTRKRKSSKIKDPYAKREASKYEKPVPSREFLLTYLKKVGKPMSLSQILMALEIEDEDCREGIRRRLIAMERDGQIIRNRKKGYLIAQNTAFVRGYVQAHKDGFGFLRPDEGGNDLFISPKEMRQVFDGDKVLARIAGMDHRGRAEVNIVEILEHNTQEIVGRFHEENGAYLLIPDNPKVNKGIVIPAQKTLNAKSGQIVVGRVLSYPSQWSIATAEITEILGAEHAPGLEIEIAMRTYELPHTWPMDVLNEIKSLKPTVASKDKLERLDLRDFSFVTIDGEDARDFDDAVYCEKRKGGYRLYVAIADVAHYVKPDTALDQEAFLRGNSVYFPDRVIPMLPEVLSNGLCSLNPKVDRLCMVCMMNIDKKGNISSYKFYEGVMRSKARLTYDIVSKILVDKDKTLEKKYHQLLPDLNNLYQLFQLLQKQRLERGAIELDIPETKIIFNEDRKIERIQATMRNDAHRLIEECMLLANVCTAHFLLKNKIPTLFRNHLGPEEDKLANLREFLGELGLTMKGRKKPKPKHYAELLSKILKRPDVMMIQTVLLRSLSQAVYHVDNEGHFGLAYEAYTHFTSPIRRYPDLLVHRALKHLIHKQKVKKFIYTPEKMSQLGAHCSMTERRADEATRQAIDWLKCEYMSSKVGEIYEGVITGVTNFGIFISLKNIFVEGLVHITSLKNDFYEFDPKRHRLFGQRTHRIYQLGQAINVQVIKVNLENRRIDFQEVLEL
jgi:ribonuclease R